MIFSKRHASKKQSSKPQTDANITYLKSSKLKPSKLANIRREIQTLDMQNYGSWSKPIKILVFACVLAIIFALVWGLLITEKREQIKAEEAKQVTLLTAFAEKQNKRNHLAEYQQQLAQMQADSQILHMQLPSSGQTAELLEQINQTGKLAGVQVQDVQIGQEVEQQSEAGSVNSNFNSSSSSSSNSNVTVIIPIKIEVLGGYHNLGTFLAEIANLPRLITLDGFQLNHAEGTTNHDLRLVLQAKSYYLKGLERTENIEQQDDVEGNETEDDDIGNEIGG